MVVDPLTLEIVADEGPFEALWNTYPHAPGNSRETKAVLVNPLVTELAGFGIPKLTVIVVEDLVSVVPAVTLYTSRAYNAFHASLAVTMVSLTVPNS